jgi:type IV pilus assembly protein PilN
VAIRVNLLKRDAPKKSGGMKGLSTGISMPKIAIGGGLAMKAAGGVFLLVVIGLLLAGYQAYAAKADHQKRITQLKAQDAQLQRQLVELRVAEAAKKEIQRRLDIIGRVAKSQKVPVEMMNGVLKAVPQGIWLTSFDVKPQEVRVKVDANRAPITYSSETLSKLAEKRDEPGTGATPASTPARVGPAQQQKEVTEIQGFSVSIKGLAFNNFQVAEFMENLKKVGVFNDVDFTVSQAANVESVRVMDFEVTANVKL